MRVRWEREKWSKKDPVTNYELYLKEIEVLKDSDIELINSEIKAEIQQGLDLAFAEEKIIPNTKEEYKDLFFPFTQKTIPPSSTKTEKRFIDAISDGLRQSMQKYPELIIMGQDVAE